MGIELKIRALLRELAGTSIFSLGPKSMRNAVVVDDVLTRVHHIYGPSPGGSFTGQEFFQAFYKPARAAFQVSKAVAYIAVCDDPVNVPVEKQSTQSQRSDAAVADNQLPYDSMSVIGAEGIKEPGQEFKPFLSGRLLRTRSLRPQVWRLMTAYLGQMSFEDNQLFVFDYDAAGPWVFQQLKAPVQRLDMFHQLGEADLALPYWVNCFPDRPVVVTTIDTDALPVLMAGTDPSRTASLLWVYPDKSKNKKKKELVYVDMLQLRQQLKSILGLELKQFVVLCLLGKTDYVEKHLCFNDCGLSALQFAVQKTPQLVESLESEDPKAISASVELAVTAALSFKLNQSKRYVLSSASYKDVYDETVIRASLSYLSKKVKLSDETSLRKFTKQIMFNYKYWAKQPAFQTQVLLDPMPTVLPKDLGLKPESRNNQEKASCVVNKGMPACGKS